MPDNRPDLAIKYATNRGLPGFDYDQQGQWNGPFFFIQGADTQLGLINDYIEEKTTTPNWDEEIRLTHLAVAAANRMQPKPKFFIVCGDLVNAFPGEPNRAAQEKDLKEVLTHLDNTIPLVCVCGNHDVGNTPTHADMAVYTDSFGDDYFSFWVAGVKCLVLNSQYYFDSSQVPDLRAKMDEWLDKELEDTKSRDCKHLIVFQHIALFLKNADEDDGYFNVPKTVRKQLIEKFQGAGIKLVFSGHYHRNAGGCHGDLESVVTSAIGAQLGDDKSGYRLVKVFDDVITHAYYAFEDVPELVDLSKP